MQSSFPDILDPPSDAGASIVPHAGIVPADRSAAARMQAKGRFIDFAV